MKIMLRITALALLISLMGLPDNLFAQSVSVIPGGFSFSDPMMVVAGILISLKVMLIFMLIHNRKRVQRSK